MYKFINIYSYIIINATTENEILSELLSRQKRRQKMSSPVFFTPAIIISVIFCIVSFAACDAPPEEWNPDSKYCEPAACNKHCQSQQDAGTDGGSESETIGVCVNNVCKCVDRSIIGCSDTDCNQTCMDKWNRTGTCINDMCICMTNPSEDDAGK